MGEYSCHKLLIIFAALQSCNEIKIQWPPFTQQSNCKTLSAATESISDIIDIFAINDWIDIYHMIVQIGMKINV